MSVKTTDILARLRAGIATLRPSQGLLDAGFECGAVSNEDFNWLFWMLYQSALGNVHKWNSECADNGGYTHPAVVLGSDGRFYITISGGDFTTDPTVSVGVDWDLFNTSELPLNHRSGYVMTRNSASVLGIGAGEARSADNTLDIIGAAITKDITAAWAEGTGLGGFPSALVLAANTWYRVFVIGKPDGTMDAGFDVSSSAATLMADAAGSGYTKYRRIGWVRTNGASQLTDFYHDPDDVQQFQWRVPVSDSPALPLPTGPRGSQVVTAPPNTRARITVEARHGLARYVLVESLETTDVVVTETNCNLATNAAGDTSTTELEVKLNSSSQLGYRADVGTFNAFNITTRGWQDNGITA